MKITSIRLDRMRLVLDPPFDAAWDPVPRRHFDATAAGLTAEVASAGLRAGAAAGPADRLARQVLLAHGYDADHAVQQFDPAMFGRYDLIIALDSQHRWVLRQIAPDAEAAQRVRLLGSFEDSVAACADVPDPAGGDVLDFERTLRLVQAAMPGVLAAIRAATGTCSAAGSIGCG